MKYAGHVQTKQSAIIVRDNGVPITVPAENKDFKKVCGLLKNKKYQEALEAADKATCICKESRGQIKVKDGALHIHKEKMPTALENLCLRFTDEGKKITPFINFWKMLGQNPSKEARNELFDFMRRSRIPLTPKGTLVCYKKVRDDFKDVYSGKFDNSLGKVVKVARKAVDPDRRQNCSNGLHVAAWDYAQSFDGSHLILVEVNPKDVVAVPTDCSCQKMRVCEYKVIAEHTGEGELPDLIYLGELDSKVEATGRVIAVDAQRRLSIPKTLISKLGATRDGKIRVLGDVAGERVVLVARKGWDKRKSIAKDLTGAEDGLRYKIDSKGGVRLSLSQTCLDVKESYEVRLCGCYIEIK